MKAKKGPPDPSCSARAGRGTSWAASTKDELISATTRDQRSTFAIMSITFLSSCRCRSLFGRVYAAISIEILREIWREGEK
eukprot:scaffold723_cov67-Cylindrotheca_fusiformis.AAC.1